MKIPKAQPKQGLETGRVQGAKGGLTTGSVQGAKGGLEPKPEPELPGAKEGIAKEYEDDLSGKNGAEARFDALQEIIATEIDAFSRGIIFSSADGTQIFGAGGKFAVKSPRRRNDGAAVDETFPSNASTNTYWNLSLSATTAGNFTISNPGTILKDISDMTDTVSITNIATEQTAVNTGVVCLKFVSQAPTACTIETLTTWNDHPSAYEITGSGATAAFTAYYFPLYYISNVHSDGYRSVGNSLFALRLVQDTCFRIINGIYRGVSTDAAVAVPVLEPFSRAIPT